MKPSRIRTLLAAWLISLAICGEATAAKAPDIIPIERIRPGMKGYGLTGFSIFDARHRRDRYDLLRPCRGGEEIDLWVEASASGLFGMILNKDPDPKDPERFGRYEARVQEAILRLSEEQRAVVLMHDYQGLAHDEIAAVLGVSHAAARKRYSRALAELAGYLREEP